ncbi:TlpA family protein disulfide reductase [Aminipila terrae]|uniref:Redoxin domain-containing protein n=1 Tax=Aminipila terrae TaxID=2697030 RepID=A0A6P1MGA4_9FIRM|nr:TlpA disulfide reductase family protein [Aminipila terrae]QHI73720.1 redoxin domain-containing protein [Aminipila terrae]
MKKLFLLLLISILTLTMFTGCSQPNNNNMNLNKNKNDTVLSAKDTIQPVASSSTPIGDFKAQDVKGNQVTKDIFSNYDLTLVNLFTTWCSPCVKEIPELNEVAKEMANKKVNVVGIVLDVNENGKIDQSKMDKLNKIIEATKADYTILLPDEVLRSGPLKGVNSVPETFFVDKNGNIVGENYLGSHTKEEWIKIINDELAKLNK